MSYAAYATVQKAGETARDLEIRAISHITRQMIDANTRDADPIARTRALNGNIRLWSLLMNDLSAPENPLPDALKANYIALGRFCHRASLAALPGKGDLATLIQINTDILDALEHQRSANV